MAITFACACGASFTVPDDLAGLHAPCPACRAALVVPPPDDDEPVSDLDVVEVSAPAYRLTDEAAPAVDDEPEVVAEVEPEEVVDDVEAVADAGPDGGGEPEYFVAAYPPGSTLRHPKTFRVYLYGDELLVLDLALRDQRRPGRRAVAGARAGVARVLQEHVERVPLPIDEDRSERRVLGLDLGLATTT